MTHSSDHRSHNSWRASLLGAGCFHLVAFAFAMAVVGFAPALHATLRDITVTHFLVALILALATDIVIVVSTAVASAPSGILAAAATFKKTLLPLFVVAFILWWVG